jgi:hypothetical protein
MYDNRSPTAHGLGSSHHRHLSADEGCQGGCALADQALDPRLAGVEGDQGRARGEHGRGGGQDEGLAAGDGAQVHRRQTGEHLQAKRAL